MQNLKIKKPLSPENEDIYLQFSVWCNNNGYFIKDDNPEYYYCEKFIIDEKTMARQRISELKRLLSDYDYIGIKIATGRATKEEYVKEIEQMTKWADEINRLDGSL